MYDELKLEEIEVSHTLGGAGEVVRGERSGGGVDAVRHTQMHQSRGFRHNIPGWVAITDQYLNSFY